jgi:hypothetical protein
MFPPGYTIRRALASRTTTQATVTNHLVRCSRSVIISPYVVSRASLLGRRPYLNVRYITLLDSGAEDFLVTLNTLGRIDPFDFLLPNTIKVYEQADTYVGNLPEGILSGYICLE